MTIYILSKSKCANCGGGIRLYRSRRDSDAHWSHVETGLRRCPISPIAEPSDGSDAAMSEREAALGGDRDALKRYFGAALDRARASERELLALRLEVEIRPLVGKDHAILDHAIRIVQDDE